MPFKKIISYINGLLIYSLVLIIFNILLTQLPLTSTFGYEFAAINGLLLSVIAGLQTISLLKKLQPDFPELIKSFFILFLIPLFVTIINSLFTMFCSFIDGLIFYVLIVIVSTSFGSSIGFIANLINKRFTRILFFMILFIVALIPVLEIYFNPQVYFYSPLIGFFPGNIYDEGLSPDWKLLFHQMIVLIFSLLIILLFIRRTSFVLKYKRYLVLSVVIIVLLFQFVSPHLGFTTTFTKLNSVLSRQIDSDLLTLNYDNIDSTQAKLIALHQEYYYLELINALKTEPSKKINVYLFNNREQKKILFGAGNADVAKPWQYSIYISADSWQNTLKHELAHVFTAEYGTGIFKLASGFNAALIEGMAESVDGISDDISIKYLTSLAYNNGYAVDVKSFFTGLSFFKSNSFLAYTYSGAFIEYLTNLYGIEKVKQFYNTGDFDFVFKSKIEAVQKDFEQSIVNPDLSDQKPMADYYFGRLSIIQKICPRYIGDRLRKAYQYLSENNLEEAENIFVEINNKIINYSALIGLSEIYSKQNKIKDGINILEKNYNKFKSSPYNYNLIFKLGDLRALNYENDSAIYYYNKIISANPNHQLKYLSTTRLNLLQRNRLIEYLEGSDSLKLELLKELNDKQYHYSSLSIIIDLLSNLKVDYKASLGIFNKAFIVDNLESSYSAFKLSQYMLENNDYVNARKYAALSLRIKDQNLFYKAMQEQFIKSKWFLKNGYQVLDKFKFSNNN